MAPDHDPAPVLAGTRVVELGGIGPVPFCGMMLADLGADVVVLRRPGAPAGNPVLDRGKREVVVDLKDAADLAAVRDLTGRAHVALEGFRPGVLERLGLGPAVLRAGNPGLVLGRMSGYGRSGPWADRAGHDINYLALSGVLGALGPADGPPVPPMNLLADFAGGGLPLAVGVLGALTSVAAGGPGRDVDAAMVDGAAQLLAMAYGNWGTGRWPTGRGADPFSGRRPYYRTYACADGRHVAVGASEPRFYAALLTGVGLDGVLDPERQTDTTTWDETHRLLAAAFRTRTRDAWTVVFTDLDACVTPVLDPHEAPRHEHLARRGTFSHDGEVPVQPAPAVRFGAGPAAVAPRGALDRSELGTLWLSPPDRPGAAPDRP